MQVTDVAIKFFRPEAAPPFVNLYRLTPKAGIVNRNPLHYHPDTIEIFAVYRGHFDWIVGEESHQLRPGDAIVIPARVPHGAIDANQQAGEVIALHLAAEELPARLGAAADQLGVLRTREPSILTLIQKVFEEHRLRKAIMPEVAAALGVLLVSTLIDLDSDEEAVQNSRMIQKAQRALMEKYGARPTVSEVADRLGISTVWLNRLFIRETGASPGDWARARRLTEAKRFLTENRLSNAEIAMELGYSSGQAFATAFRQVCGMTPTDYRTHHKTPLLAEPPTEIPMRIIYQDRDEVIAGIE